MYGIINLHHAKSIQKEKKAEKYLPDLVAKAPGNHRILEEVRIYVASGASMDNDRFYNFCNLR